MSSPSNSGLSPSPRPRGYLSRAAAASPSPVASPASPAPSSSPAPPDNVDDVVDAADADADDDDDAPRPDSPDSPDSPDLPLTMTASTVLLNLPRDATAALASAGQFSKDKVVVRFKPVGSAPSLAASGGGDVRRKIVATHKFESVVAFVRRTLKVAETESVFLYVNSAFAPALDEVVGNLHQCFKDSHDQLNVTYSLTPAFG